MCAAVNQPPVLMMSLLRASTTTTSMVSETSDSSQSSSARLSTVSLVRLSLVCMVSVGGGMLMVSLDASTTLLRGLLRETQSLESIPGRWRC